LQRRQEIVVVIVVVVVVNVCHPPFHAISYDCSPSIKRLAFREIIERLVGVFQPFVIHHESLDDVLT